VLFQQSKLSDGFFTVPEIQECFAYFHSYFATLMAAEAVKKELPPVILLTVDVTFSKQPDRLPVKAFVQKDMGQGHVPVFQPLQVEMDTFPGESVTMGVISKSLKSERREVQLPSTLQQIENGLDRMISWFEKLQNYIGEVLSSGNPPADPEIGRKLMEVVTEASTQIQPEKLEGFIKTSLRDYLMVDYLAKLTKAQLALQRECLLFEGTARTPRT